MSSAAGNLVRRLAERRTASGGYEAVPGAGASTESTALAALALGDAAAHAWLLAHQRPDGAWPLGEAMPEASWASAWALAALAGDAVHADVLVRGARWLSAREGRRPSWFARTLFEWTGGDRRVDHDLALRGWPWHADAASWCEPTACALLALRMLGARAGAAGEERIREGEALLWDRTCVGGGWNYGNRRVLGEVLPPYPDTTALVLISLQGSSRRAKLAESFAALDRLLAERASSLALGLAALARALHGLDPEPQRRALEARLAHGEPHETRVLAFALLALRGDARRLAVPA